MTTELNGGGQVVYSTSDMARWKGARKEWDRMDTYFSTV